MDMDWREAALALAGLIGGATAVFHGVLTQRLMVRPILARLEEPPRAAGWLRRMTPALLHFSTFSWLVGGVALIAAAIWSGPEGRLATGLVVGSSYLAGAAGNFWATRGRHPGWLAMAAALVLIVAGLWP